MKNDATQSNKPSTRHAGSVPDRHASEAGKAGQEQHEKSGKTSGVDSKDAKQQRGAGKTSSNTQQNSPSRDQGHSPSGSSNTDGSNARPDRNSPRQTGKNR